MRKVTSLAGAMRFWTGGCFLVLTDLTYPRARALPCQTPRDVHIWSRFHFLRWRRLKAQMIEKRSKLGESQTLQQFSRDVDEIEAWISEKLQTASDESYKDPTNIQVS